MKVAHLSLVGTAVIALSSLSFAQSSPSAVAAPNQVEPQTCTGQGADKKCLYCIRHEGGKHCFWVKVPEKPKSAGKEMGAIAGASTHPSAKRQACRGSGESHQCRYCVTVAGTKSCQWVKIPLPTARGER